MFFFNDTATTEIYTLSLHDALPICTPRKRQGEIKCHWAGRRSFGNRPARGRSHRLGNHLETGDPIQATAPLLADRKSTRLNSSHANISYAVFCLQNKTFLSPCPI